MLKHIENNNVKIVSSNQLQYTTYIYTTIEMSYFIDTNLILQCIIMTIFQNHLKGFSLNHINLH